MSKEKNSLKLSTFYCLLNRTESMPYFKKLTIDQLVEVEETPIDYVGNQKMHLLFTLFQQKYTLHTHLFS